MTPREERGAAIAKTQTLTEKNGVWVVPSQSGNGRYHVFPDAEKPHCTCPDHMEYGHVCKHIFAVRFTMTRTTLEVGMDGAVTTTTETVTVKTTADRRTYPQNWPAYNAAQTAERRHFHELLADLCANIPDDPKNPKGGRPGIPMRDAMYAAVLKVYSLMSARRFQGELEEAHDAGFLSRLPHFNCVLRAFNEPDATGILKTMIETTALPLRAVEEKFAIDSTGFGTTTYQRWHEFKHGTGNVHKAYARFVKAHFVTGCLTNLVTSVEIDHQDAGDSPFLPPLTKRTAEIGFTIKDMTADCAYASNVNFAAVESVGGTFIPMFKSNSTGYCGGAFAKAFHLFSLQKDEYLKRYHVRSNVETTVSMVKRKFGDSVKAKNELAQKNEVYAKFVCHNVCVLIAEMYNLGITPVLCPKTTCTETSEVAPILRFPGAV